MKNWWWSVFLDGRCCSLELVSVSSNIRNEDDESLSLLTFRRDVANAIFLKYSKESRSSLIYVGIRIVPSDVLYDDTKHYQVPFEKQLRCKVCKEYKLQIEGVQKELPRLRVKCKVNINYTCFEIFHGYQLMTMQHKDWKCII